MWLFEAERPIVVIRLGLLAGMLVLALAGVVGFVLN